MKNNFKAGSPYMGTSLYPIYTYIISLARYTKNI